MARKRGKGMQELRHACGDITIYIKLTDMTDVKNFCLLLLKSRPTVVR